MKYDRLPPLPGTATKLMIECGIITLMVIAFLFIYMTAIVPILKERDAQCQISKR